MPRPRPLSFMSGPFDHPPASDPPQERADHQNILDILDNTRSADEISPSGELLNLLDRYNRRRLSEAIAHRESASMSSEPEPERRRRLRSDGEASPLFVLPSNPPSAGQSPRERATARLASYNARRGRARPIPSERYRREVLGESSTASSRNGIRGLEDLRAATRDLNEVSSNLLQDAGRQLELANSALRGFRHDGADDSSPLRESEYPGEVENNRRVKRRKLDTDRLDSGFAGFKYGKYGQVEPGKLKMEIVSCDGGIFEDTHGVHGAENVLRNDHTVYCTKSNRCNLVLRHQGATVFSLKELVIKAPHTGYTAPVQEGMVFISMTSDDLLTRTAQYQIQYSPARNRRSHPSHPDDLPPIISNRHSGDGSLSTAQERARRLYNIGVQDEDCDYRTAQIPSDFTANAPPFQVTTECSESEDDNEDTAARRRHRSLHRLMGAGLRFEDSDSSDTELSNLVSHDFHDLSPRIRRREIASSITLAEAAEASQVATQEAVSAVGGELMVPHARFFIERDKSKCTVRFDPPVSGRFILLKMWSPHHSPTGNIDIQSVVAKGYAGPRFFPAINLR